MVHCEAILTKERYSSKMVEKLFKTYLVLKGLEGYEHFWAQNGSSEYAKLASQKYLREEKSLGYRYLKSKIALALDKQ